MYCPRVISEFYKNSYDFICQIEDGTNIEIHAENFEIRQERVPKLKHLCLLNISKFFMQLCPKPELLGLDYEYLISALPVDIDMKYIIDFDNEIYWQKKFEFLKEEYELLDAFYAPPWKNTYLQKYLELMIEKADKSEDVVELASMIKDYITKLKITTLKCLKYGSEENQLNHGHLDLDNILIHLQNLEELNLSHRLFNDHNQFYYLFKLSLKDYFSIFTTLTRLPKFKSLIIGPCWMDESRVRLLTGFAIEMANLTNLEVSHCNLGDECVMLISRVIMFHSELKKVNLSDNSFGDVGMQSLAYAIANQKQPSLVSINLRRNCILERGGEYLASAIVHTKEKLKEVILSGCGLSGYSAKKISDSFRYSLCIESIDIGANDFSEAEDILLRSLRCNVNILDIEVRYSGISEDFMDEIKSIITSNNKRKKRLEDLERMRNEWF